MLWTASLGNGEVKDKLFCGNLGDINRVSQKQKETKNFLKPWLHQLGWIMFNFFGAVSVAIEINKEVETHDRGLLKQSSL